MLLLIDIFSINRSQGYENPSLDIIVIDLYSTGGHPEAREHCSQNQSVISVVILISFHCYCGDCSSYIVVILPFLSFYFRSAYFLYMVYYRGWTGSLSRPIIDGFIPRESPFSTDYKQNPSFSITFNGVEILDDPLLGKLLIQTSTYTPTP
jgi:hypothetical protein